jgi:hypothetical protein
METAASRPESGALHGYRSGRPLRIALFVVLAAAIVAAALYLLARG